MTADSIPADKTVPTSGTAPVTPSFRRIDSMDLLRGVAILGIFLMNTWSFSQPQSAYTNPNDYSPEWIFGQGFPEGHENIHGLELAVFSIIHIVADMKFITIFSVLFGAGILLQGERAAARGLSPWKIHYSRMVVLLLFGMIHALTLWYGDILAGYACCGMLLFPLRKARPTLLIVLGMAMIAMGSAINFAVQAGIHLPVLEPLQNWNDALTANVGGNNVELEIYRSGWLEQIHRHRFIVSYTGLTYGFVTWTFWRCGGCILIGMALHQRKFFHGVWPRATYATLAVFTIPVGWAITSMGLVYNIANNWDDAGGVFSVWGFGMEFNYWGSLVTQLGYLSLGVLVAIQVTEPAHVLLQKCLWPLRAIGRTALSNYILQSLLATTLFYGHGFGLFGTMTHVDLLYVIAGVWSVQLILSPLYLSMFAQGPLEWVWHRLVYWRGEPPPLKDATETA